MLETITYSDRLLDKYLKEIPSLRKYQKYTSQFTRWSQNVDYELGRLFGVNSGPYLSWRAIDWSWKSGTVMAHILADPQEVQHEQNMKAYRQGLDFAEGILQSAVDQLQQHGLVIIESERCYQTEGAQRKIFISHGKITSVLDRIERYIRALGLEPVIVGRLPSVGKAVDDLVEERMAECQCAIILATCDDKVNDYYQPRPNVIHEIGLAQEKLKDKIIYLKEQGCRFSSNTQPKVWEDFTQDNLEAAFEKIAKELRAFKLIY